jgi:TPR repeat protein
MATLLVTCDLACDWELDDTKMGRIAAGSSARARVFTLGRHDLSAWTPDGPDAENQHVQIDARTTEQMPVSFDLTQVRASRLKDENDCDGGNADACSRAAGSYNSAGEDNLNGGAARYYAKARTLHQKACDGGIGLSCQLLAVLYEYGNGGPEDDARARVLYKHNCDVGYWGGCTDLGLFYELGVRGVAKDLSVARALYKKACDGGYEYGCFKLKDLH